MLLDLGVRLGQGYLFGAPEPLETVAEALSRRRDATQSEAGAQA